MNNLVNLLKLQFNSLFAIKKNLFSFLAFYFVFSFFQPSWILTLSAIYIMFSCYSTFAYDEKSKINYLIYSLPIKLNDYIISKYIYCLINTLIAVLISIVFNLIVHNLSFVNPNNIMPIPVIIFITSLIGLFYTAIVMPVALLLGFEKGKYVFILIFSSIGFLSFITSKNLLKRFPSLPSLNPITLSVIGILIAVTILLASYFITSNMFSKKEIRY